MVDFTITSEQECLINGVGHVLPGEEVVVDADLFMMLQGYPITEANFPPFVKVTASVEEGVE